MASTSKIQIKYEALENNINFIRQLVGENTKISAVIKGNAYGHGTRVTLPALEKCGIDHFSVYSSPEAISACKVKSPDSTIMIMGFIYQKDFGWILQNEVEFYVSDLHTLEKAYEAARHLEKQAHIHLDLETGMYRTGLSLKDLKKAIQIIKDNPDYFKVIGITTHFAGAETIANHTRVRKQFSLYNKRLKYIQEQGLEYEIRHVASSAATINYPDTRLDMVRTGVLVYGYWPTRETFMHYIYRRKDKSDPLQRAFYWTSQVTSIKTIPEGEFIGYGMSFQAGHKMKTMLIPVGYCNGYSRSLSNNGYVIVNGQSAPVIGSVNMNMIICDITHLGNIKVGDKVMLVGKQGDNELSFSSFAEMNNALNYEILARIPGNIERRLVKNKSNGNGKTLYT